MFNNIFINYNNNIEIINNFEIESDDDYFINNNIIRNKNQIYDSNEYICSKKSIGTQTDLEKDINSNSFSTDDEIVFNELDKKLSPIIENKLISSEKIKIISPYLKETQNIYTEKNNDKSFEIIKSNKEKQNVKFLPLYKSKSLSTTQLSEEISRNNKNNLVIDNVENIDMDQKSEEISNKRNSILSNPDDYGKVNKRSSILSNPDKNTNVSFSLRTKKMKKDNSNISKLISLFENNDENKNNNKLKMPISKSDEYININKIGSIKNHIKKFSNNSLDSDDNSLSRFSLLDDNYDFEGKNTHVINFQSNDQLKIPENDEIINEDDSINKNENINENRSVNDNEDIKKIENKNEEIKNDNQDNIKGINIFINFNIYY